MNDRFRDRREAGRALAGRIAALELQDPVVLALPRGGVPVAVEVARALGAPLDVLVVRKLGVPAQPELAMGAVASGGIRVMNDEVLRMAHVGETEVQQVVERETRELERRERVYRGERPSVNVTGRTAVVVDDGIATGSSMIAAIRSLRPRGATRIVVAVPVAPTETLHRLADEADEVVCVVAPEPFHAISLWYHAFPQLEDAEVRQALENASTRPD